MDEVLSLVEPIYKFVKRNTPQYRGKEKELWDAIYKHVLYETFDVCVDEKGLKAFVRFNVTPSGRVLDVLDLVIREDATNGREIIKNFVSRAVMSWPELEILRYYRTPKYPKRGMKTYRIKRFLKKGVVLYG